MSHDQQLISVIIPVYNGAAYIAPAIDSVLHQAYPFVEIIVVDDGSTDETAAIVAQYGDKVRYLYQPNCGSAVARNAGVALAKGALLAFLDHDDLWDPAKLRYQADYLAQHPPIGYVLTRMKPLIAPGIAWPTTLNQHYYAQNPVAVFLSALLVRRQVFAQVGPFDPSLRTAQDVDWFARAQDLGIQSGVVEQVLLYKRIHNNNISLNTAKGPQNLLQALKHSVLRKKARQIGYEMDQI